jgi:hypothetical protein
MQLRSRAEIPLPESYLQLLAVTNGGEGDLGVEPGWISFWSAEEVLDLNQSYELAQHVPGLFGIGSNGGGELIALDSREELPFPVVAIPFSPLDAEDAMVIAPNFDALVSFLGVSVDADG